MISDDKKHIPSDTDQIMVSRKEYENLRSENFYLRHELDKLKRMIFGAKSERFIPRDSSQLSLDLIQGVQPLACQQPKRSPIPIRKPMKRKAMPARNFLPICPAR